MSSNETPSAVPEAAPAGPGSLSRVLGALWSPGRTFASVAARPAVLVPMLVLLVFQMVMIGALYAPVFAPFQKTQMAERMADLSPDQRAQVERQQQAMDTPAGRAIGMVSALVFGSVFYLLQLVVWAAVLYFVFTLMMSGRAQFKVVLSVALYAAAVDIPHFLVLAPLAVARQDPRVYFGPAALVDAPSPVTFPYILLTRLDVFSLWAWGLAAVGLALAYKKKSQQVMVAVGAVFVVAAVITAAIQAATAAMFHVG
ncbi:MAG TPA: YIP1 family protein, partial [Candidatus Saccharimonadales bacterium]|nr:YIP1 family protein [Candidatus Saccharimonadales bacterium]